MIPKKIGSKHSVQTKAQELPEYAQLINQISTKTMSEVENWVDQNFPRMNEVERNALKVLTKATWALAKLVRRQYREQKGVEL